MSDDVHPRLLKHWRGALRLDYSWFRSTYHAFMYEVLEPFLGKHH